MKFVVSLSVAANSDILTRQTSLNRSPPIDSISRT
jgi:hypothetical protein